MYRETRRVNVLKVYFPYCLIGSNFGSWEFDHVVMFDTYIIIMFLI